MLLILLWISTSALCVQLSLLLYFTSIMHIHLSLLQFTGVYSILWWFCHYKWGGILPSIPTTKFWSIPICWMLLLRKVCMQEWEKWFGTVAGGCIADTVTNKSFSYRLLQTCTRTHKHITKKKQQQQHIVHKLPQRNARGCKIICAYYKQHPLFLYLFLIYSFIYLAIDTIAE